MVVARWRPRAPPEAENGVESVAPPPKGSAGMRSPPRECGLEKGQHRAQGTGASPLRAGQTPGVECLSRLQKTALLSQARSRGWEPSVSNLWIRLLERRASRILIKSYSE